MKPYLVTPFPSSGLRETVWRHLRSRRDFLIWQEETPVLGKFGDVLCPMNTWCDTMDDATKAIEHLSLSNPGVKFVICNTSQVSQVTLDPNAKINTNTVSEKGMLPA